MKKNNSARPKSGVHDAAPRAHSAPEIARMGASVVVPAKWRWHYRVLLALRRRLLEESDAQRSAAAEPIEPHSSHAADSATDEIERDVALALLAREENALRDINDAITQILEGSYGVCAATGAKIPVARLRALPWCRYTFEAERRFERTAGDARVQIPEVTSLRGKSSNLPETGTVTRKNSEGPVEEPAERKEPAVPPAEIDDDVVGTTDPT